MEPHPIVSLQERLAIWVVIGTTTLSVLSSMVLVAHSSEAPRAVRPASADVVRDSRCAAACTAMACAGQR